ncbi:hypothetical protein BDQ17DRAFT_1546592 [Cyathus striatus]|nr:hypothetical protein BDQ17DRAFT_1546592 [Cyathus striatus]
MVSTNQSSLNLNPGGPHRRPVSIWMCYFYTTTIFLLSTLAVLKLADPWRFYKNIRSPHASIYQNATLDKILNRTSVIQPMIDEKQKFDIVASVWVRDGPISEENEAVTEKLLFSDIVFRDVTLKDKGVMNEVNVQVPTAIFKSSGILTSFDLRGSFALVPSGSSLLGNVVSFTSWIPNTVIIPLARPMGERESSLYDGVINQYSLHIPLVEFHPAKFRCADEGAEEYPTDDEISSLQKQAETDKSIFRTNKNLTTLTGHPYLVTRSHIRAVDFTRVLNFEEFSKAHQKFSQSSCGQGKPNTTVSWRSCLRSDKLSDSGLWKTTLLKLGVPEEHSEVLKNSTEWAYTPYMSAIKHARGPLDLQSVPVNRQECSSISAPDEDFVNMTWKITYSGRSPVKVWVGDEIDAFFIHPNMSDPEHLKAGQAFSEMKHGIYGHRHSEDAHPRRYLGVRALKIIGSTAIKILNILYWYARVSTVGISLSGYLLMTASDIIEIAFIGANSVKVTLGKDVLVRDHLLLYLWITLFSIGPFWAILNLLKLKAMMRVQISRWGIIPTFKRLPSNHAERTSSRMDAKLSWPARVFGVISLAFLYVYESRDYNPWREFSLYRKILYVSVVLHPLQLIGTVSQLVLNHRGQKFASMYKLTAYIMLFKSLLDYVPSHRFLFSEESSDYVSEPSNSYYYICTGVQIVLAYQALQYPYAVYNAEEDDD